LPLGARRVCSGEDSSDAGHRRIQHVGGNAFVKGTWGVAIVDDLTPADGDSVIEGKRGLDTFAGANLDLILRGRGIDTVILGGFLTNCCVESTMRSAYENGYRVITLTDCMAATSPESRDNAIAYDFPTFSLPMEPAEVRPLSRDQ
jgi:nicotinamidase-related amidase